MSGKHPEPDPCSPRWFVAYVPEAKVIIIPASLPAQAIKQVFKESLVRIGSAVAMSAIEAPNGEQP